MFSVCFDRLVERVRAMWPTVIKGRFGRTLALFFSNCANCLVRLRVFEICEVSHTANVRRWYVPTPRCDGRFAHAQGCADPGF